MRRSALLLALLALATLLPACAHERPRERMALAIAPRAVPIARGADNAPATWDQVVADAAAADVVLIGETHGHPVGLASAAALWQDILAHDDHAALALEFFERDEQSHLDDYLAGLTDEKAFRDSAHRTAGSYPPGHAQMVEAAKAAKRPVIASNAPRVYVRAARKDGYDRLAALSPEQRRLFRIPDQLPTGPYRERFDEVMGGMPSHTGPTTQPVGQKTSSAGKSSSATTEPEETPEQRQARLDASFRSQSLWDWTMADSIVRALEGYPSLTASTRPTTTVPMCIPVLGVFAANPSRPVVQVVGRFHVEFNGGLAQAIQKLRPGTRIVTIVYTDEEPGPSSEDPKLAHAARADYVVHLQPAEDEKAAGAR